MLDNLAALRAIGVTVAIDDFGTGYSSLSAIANLPIERLKIDQSFVSALPGSAGDTAVLTTIIALGKQLNLEVLAEGVQTPDQSRALLQESCELAPGFDFARPLEAPQATEVLQVGSLARPVTGFRKRGN
ncbi:EAL domain-containing protein [Candidatus Nanopelagicales bacterium]|nr:EAL domain-containing protein [Candidatus Nanopelagicales bacterium]